MHRCEAHELAISSLIDGELETETTLATIDHVLACQACASFFQKARGLENRLAPLQEARRPRLSRTSPPPRRRRPWATAYPAAAAVAVLVVGLALGRVVSILPERTPPAAEVEAGDGQKMSDDRFVAVATELLQADRRDRIEMLQVLQHVQDWSTEESPGRVAALRTDVDLSPRWSQLSFSGEVGPAREVY